MRSNEVSVLRSGAPALQAPRSGAPIVAGPLVGMRAGPRNAIDRLHARDRLESIARLRAAVLSLAEVDVSGWDDSALVEHLEEISSLLCAIDAQLTRVADGVRSRGFRIAEPLAA